MCFDSCTINIRASIRVRGMHLVLGAEPVKINRVPKTVREDLGGFGAEPGQVQQGSGEGPGEG